MKTILPILILSLFAAILAPASDAEDRKIPFGKEKVILAACGMLADEPEKVHPGITWDNVTTDITTCLRNPEITKQQLLDLKRSNELLLIMVGEGIESSPAAKEFFGKRRLMDIQILLGGHKALIKQKLDAIK